MSHTPWEIPSSPKLLKEEIHIWKSSLDSSLDMVAFNQQFLNPAEIQRANRFSFEKDRQHFILSRGMLRQLLSHYLNCSPQAISFIYNAHGRPALAPEDNLNFNVSHSHSLVVYAFAYDRMLGIDVEYCRTDRNMKLVAKSFSDVEQAQLNELAEEDYVKGFYNCWTRKEAYIKASGKGFAIPLKSFDVSLEPTHPRILHIEAGDYAAADWILLNLPVPTEYAGTLAVNGTAWHPRYFQF